MFSRYLKEQVHRLIDEILDIKNMILKLMRNSEKSSEDMIEISNGHFRVLKCETEGIKTIVSDGFNHIHDNATDLHYIKSDISDIKKELTEIKDSLKSMNENVSNMALLNNLNFINFYDDLLSEDKIIEAISESPDCYTKIVDALNDCSKQIQDSSLDPTFITQYTDQLCKVIDNITAPMGRCNKETVNSDNKGRQPISDETVHKIIELYNTSWNNYTEIARITGVSRATVRKYVNQYKESLKMKLADE